MHFNYDVVMIPLQLIIVFFTIYYFVVSWFGLFGKMRETKQFPEKSTFALIEIKPQKLPATPAPLCMNASAKRGRGKVSPWNGCSTACSVWNASTMQSVYSMRIIWCIRIS